MAAPEPKKPDPLVALARASAAKRRRSKLPALLLILLVFGAVAGFVWWVWPRSEYPLLALAVFDQVTHPEGTAIVTASFEQVEASERDPNILGSTVYLRETGLQQYKQAACDATGFARLEWPLAAGIERVQLAASYPGAYTRRGTQTSATLYAWPPDSRCAVVEVEGTLLKSGEEEHWKTNNVDLKLVEGAAPALQALARSRRIVYYSSGADRATRYNKLRAWLFSHVESAETLLPDGPLLAAGAWPEAERPQFGTRTLDSLKQLYRGPHVGLTSDPATAKLFREQGLEVWLLAPDATAPADLPAAKSWAEFQKFYKP